ncbi:MAG TPA: hypothetical protein PLY93_08150, partial [Turneriella sp.]|nr:hypothetical protein [Turneriella sp.]
MLAAGLGCYYDANPPDESLIHDEKPLLMLDINLGAGVTQKSIQIKFTDAFGSTTLEGASLKTDATGRLLYPLRMQHGTRGYTLDSIIVDQSGQGTFAEAADLTWDKIASP